MKKLNRTKQKSLYETTIELVKELKVNKKKNIEVSRNLLKRAIKYLIAYGNYLEDR